MVFHLPMADDKGFIMSRVLYCVICLAILAGCENNGDLPATYPVTGSVTFKNKPVASGTITFHPIAADGNPAVSLIDEQGRFELTTYDKNDGAVPGFHNVTIVVAPRMDGSSAGEADVIPAVYNRPETTPLSLEVQSNGSNHFEIELKEN